MRKEVGLISLATSALLVVVLVVGAVQVVRYRQIQHSQLGNVNQTSSNPGGLVVALNAPTNTDAKGVMVNYLSPDGVAVRTRPIPNAGVKTAHFQVVQDDVFVYTELGDEPGLRRMDESGSLSAGVDIRRGVSGDGFWLVSPDGKRVAWSESAADQGVTSSVLYTAGIDGSDKQQVASLVEAGEFYLRPVTWVEIEPEVWSVWYVKQPLNVVLADPVGPLFSSGQTISADTAAFHFSGEQKPTSIQSTEQGVVLVANNQTHLLTGATQAAEGTWSPDQQYVAVAAGAGETAWVEIWEVSTDTVTRVLPEESTDILHVVGWLDHDTLALSVLNAEHPFQSKIYVVNADGSFFRKAWDGFPIGVVPALE
jgi:hypothetical protein